MDTVYSNTTRYLIPLEELVFESLCSFSKFDAEAVIDSFYARDRGKPEVINTHLPVAKKTKEQAVSNFVLSTQMRVWQSLFM